MTKAEKINACIQFFEDLSNRLQNKYSVMGSCNNDISSYLCPIGTEWEVSYNGKPEMSFRVSDHWNWFANVKRCSRVGYVQCYSPDLPFAKKRMEKGKASTPIYAISVMIFINNKYVPVYGETFDRNNRAWSWVDNSVDTVISKYHLLEA